MIRHNVLACSVAGALEIWLLPLLAGVNARDPLPDLSYSGNGTGVQFILKIASEKCEPCRSPQAASGIAVAPFALMRVATPPRVRYSINCPMNASPPSDSRNPHNNGRTDASSRHGYASMIGLRLISRTFALLGLVWTLCSSASWAEGGHGEGTDIAFGGVGDGDGQFREFRDLTTDPEGKFLCVLEGREWDDHTNQPVGNLRVQRFDLAGKFLAKFSISTDKLTALLSHDRRDANLATGIAVDHVGRVYVAQQRGNLVQQFSAEGQQMAAVEIPNASAIARWVVNGKERIAVMSDSRANNISLGADRVFLIDPTSGGLDAPLKLSDPVTEPRKLSVDPHGNLCIVGGTNQILSSIRQVKGSPSSAAGRGPARRMGASCNSSRSSTVTAASFPGPGTVWSDSIPSSRQS